MTLCLHCNSETTNPKFCSSSCSASYNNRLKPLKYSCKKCSKPISFHRNNRCCYDCVPKNNNSLVVDLTIEQAIYTRHHRSSAYALIRTRARQATSKLPRVCTKCGYDKHVEVCHIKPISSFSSNTLLSVVNSLDNLVLLCPNCHWEHDHALG